MSDDANRTPLSADETRALSSVLDEIVPPSGDGKLPGAGELGLVAYIEEVMRKTPALRPAVLQGLSVLQRLSGERGAESFSGLAAEKKTQVLNEMATEEPAFLPGLIFQTYAGYYQNPRVLGALGMPPRPPHPEGYTIAESDLSLLDPVRAQPRRYRED